jgi:hypothetical protein
MTRRREALGRNRRGRSTRNLVPTFIGLSVALAAAGWFVFDYFTAPQRVFGAKTLDCGATEINWRAAPAPDTFIIEGCGKSVRATCLPQSACEEANHTGQTF